jgi:hypothetical protein
MKELVPNYEEVCGQGAAQFGGWVKAGKGPKK